VSPTLAVTWSGVNLWTSYFGVSEAAKAETDCRVHTAPTLISTIFPDGLLVEDVLLEVALVEPEAVGEVDCAFAPATRATAAVRRYDVNMTAVMLLLCRHCCCKLVVWQQFKLVCPQHSERERGRKGDQLAEGWAAGNSLSIMAISGRCSADSRK
jgi:hypothetical protein